MTKHFDHNLAVINAEAKRVQDVQAAFSAFALAIESGGRDHQAQPERLRDHCEACGRERVASPRVTAPPLG